jgi:hypothetical protein
MFEQSHIDAVSAYVPDLEQSIFAAKSMIESDHSNIDTTFIRMYQKPFFSEDNSVPQLIFVSVDTVKDDLIKKYYRTAAVMQAYNSLSADSVLITNSVTYENDDLSESNSLVVMALSPDNAYLFVNPFTVQDNEIIWHEENFTSSHVDDFQFDSLGNDIISMYYHFTHLDNILYSSSEVYSFLSKLNIVFAPVPGSSAQVDYFDFSDMTPEQHREIQSTLI